MIWHLSALKRCLIHHSRGCAHEATWGCRWQIASSGLETALERSLIWRKERTGPNTTSWGNPGKYSTTLQWRPNESDGVSNHQPHIVYSAVYSGADQRKHQSSVSLAFVLGIHRGPVNSPLKRPVITRKMFPFDDIIMFRVSPSMRRDCDLVFTKEVVHLTVSRV